MRAKLDQSHDNADLSSLIGIRGQIHCTAACDARSEGLVTLPVCYSCRGGRTLGGTAVCRRRRWLRRRRADRLLVPGMRASGALVWLTRTGSAAVDVSAEPNTAGMNKRKNKPTARITNGIAIVVPTRSLAG